MSAGQFFPVNWADRTEDLLKEKGKTPFSLEFFLRWNRTWKLVEFL
jgi:hypothetical protein